MQFRHLAGMEYDDVPIKYPGLNMEMLDIKSWMVRKQGQEKKLFMLGSRFE